MKTTHLHLVIIFFLLHKSVVGQYCTSNTRYTDAAFFDASQITSGVNVAFGSAKDHLGNTYTLLMDLYYPNLGLDPSPKRPCVVMFHGGGFSSGDKQSGDIKDVCIHLARRGFVCASVNYRLGYDFTEYGQFKARYRAIQDGHAAVRFIVNNANTVRIDTSWLFVGGQSAGSLLALGMVYADQAELDSISLLYTSTATSVELGNLYSSGNTLTNSYSFKGVFNNWGAVAKNEIDSAELLPTVAFHGARDSTVRIDSDSTFLHYKLEGSRSLHHVLIKNAICSELTVDTTGGHGIFRNASSEFRASRASCFFKSIFCNTCNTIYTTDSIPSHCSIITTINESAADLNIKISPNPYENSFRIEGVSGILEISIFDTFGTEVFKGEIENQEVSFLSTPGLYFLRIKALHSNKIITTKLVKK